MLDALDRLAGEFTGFLDLENVRVADGEPDLLAVRISCHGGVGLCTARHNADVVARQFRIENAVALGLRGQGGHLIIRQALSAGH